MLFPIPHFPTLTSPSLPNSTLPWHTSPTIRLSYNLSHFSLKIIAQLYLSYATTPYPQLSKHTYSHHKLYISTHSYKCIRQWVGFVRIFHECEGGVEKSFPRITNWHNKACRVMTICNRETWIFLSHPHTSNVFYFLLITKCLIYVGKTQKRIPENPKYAEMRHGDVILTLQWRHKSTWGQRAGVLFLSFPRAGTGAR